MVWGRSGPDTLLLVSGGEEEAGTDLILDQKRRMRKSSTRFTRIFATNMIRRR